GCEYPTQVKHGCKRFDLPDQNESQNERQHHVPRLHHLFAPSRASPVPPRLYIEAERRVRLMTWIICGRAGLGSDGDSQVSTAVNPFMNRGGPYGAGTGKRPRPSPARPAIARPPVPPLGGRDHRDGRLLHAMGPVRDPELAAGNAALTPGGPIHGPT